MLIYPNKNSFLPDVLVKILGVIFGQLSFIDILSGNKAYGTTFCIYIHFIHFSYCYSQSICTKISIYAVTFTVHYKLFYIPHWCQITLFLSISCPVWSNVKISGLRSIKELYSPCPLLPYSMPLGHDPWEVGQRIPEAPNFSKLFFISGHVGENWYFFLVLPNTTLYR